MFPMLFPYGIGGFDDSSCQANYYLDIDDCSHLHTYFTVCKTHFDTVAKNLTSLSAPLIASVASHLEHEGKYADLSTEQKQALDLLKHINTVAARIPSSHASKILVHNEIRNYIGYFGLPHIYLTMNPNLVHSPIFQVMFGDTEVDLSSRFLQLVTSSECALCLAKAPIAAADFFKF
ncbi:hypothetical protein K439DRAFT_1649908 [Ramaria rubella]|nr:hypothetical protein K439DRAFT_1649908 [Ramaria rubella]